MASKLKDLRITKVDFVDAGANPEANIMIYKSKEGVPTGAKEEKTPEKTDGEPKSMFKRMMVAMAKVLGVDADADVSETIETLAKSDEAESFNERIYQMAQRRIADEVWDVCYALEGSFRSILFDDESTAESKAAAMKESLEQFTAAASKMIPAWAGGKTIVTEGEEDIAVVLEKAMTPEQRVEHAKEARARLDEIIKQAEPEAAGQTTVTNTTDLKGELEDMKIDKSKLTPEELAALEAIEKKAGIVEEPQDEGSNQADVAKADSVEKKAEGEAAEETEDIYKGLHPTIKAELESLRKTAEKLEDRELHEIAKKYEIIGKKADELVPTLKSLKAAGGDAYDQMIALLDANVEAFEKSGIFSEIGKKGSGSADAWAAIEKKAEEIRKSKPELTAEQAIDEACIQNPELVKEYEDQK